MVMSDKQRQDLHRAILEYLVANNFEPCASAFQEAANVVLPTTDSSKATGLLEKKWTSVVRLQRKVMELEAKIEQMELDQTSSGGIISRRDVVGSVSSRYLPKAPAKYTMSAHRSPITCVVFHPVFSVVASSSEDASIKIWDFETGEYERTLKGHTSAVQCIAFNPAGTILASASADLMVKLWDFTPDGSYECKKTLRGHDHNVSCVAFLLPSGEKLVSCSRDQTVKLWQVDTGYCVKTFSDHSDWVRAVTTSADGNWIASAGNDQTIRVWDSSSGNVKCTLREHEHVIECLCFSNALADQTLAAAAGSTTPELHLLSGSRDRTVRLWSVATGVLLRSFTSHENWVRDVKFHPNGKYALSVSEDKTIRAFDLETGRCVRTIDNAHGHFVTCLSVHPTLPILATGGIDKVISVWECV